jgi:hypothetical protein
MSSGAAKTRLIGAAMPKGARPPHPGLLRNLIRCLWFLAVLLLVLRPLALEWADMIAGNRGNVSSTRSSGPVTMGDAPPPELPALPFPELPDPLYLMAEAAQRLYTPPLALGVQGIVWFGAALLLLELLMAGVVSCVQPHVLRWQARRALTYRVRAPRHLPVPGGRYITEPDHDLFRAIAGAIPTGGRWWGWAPWVALTLGGQPDQPIELGITIVGGWQRRRRIATAIINALTGLQPGVVVDECPDHLRAALLPGRVAVWREYGLVLPPHYPLRLLHDIDHSVLMGPLVSALRPRDGVVAMEAQFIIRPLGGAHGSMLHRGWRGHATALRIRLDAKQDYALADDVKALDAKLGGVAYETTIRVVAVTEGARAYRNATQMLNMVGDAFGEYQARTSHHVQRLTAINTTRIWLRRRPRWRRWWYGQTWGWVWRLVALLVFVAGMQHVWHAPPPLVPQTLVSLLPENVMVGELITARWVHLSVYGIGLAMILRAFLVLSYVIHGVHKQRMIDQVVGRMPRAVPSPTWFVPAVLWRQPMVLSSLELGGFWHLPTPWVGNLVQWLPCRHLPAPPAAFTNGASRRIMVGHARRGDGSYAPVGPSLRDLRQPLHITAGMGAGKSRLGVNILRQIVHEGFTLIDGKGDDAGNLTLTIRQQIPREDEARVVILDVLDAEWPIGINPLAAVDLSKPGAIDLVLGQVEAIFARIDSATWAKSPGMQQFLRNATLLVIEGHGMRHDASGQAAQLRPSTAGQSSADDPPQAPTLAHIKQALIDARYRETLLPKVQNIDVKSFWELTFPALSESQRTSLHALLRRFDMLLTTELTRLLLTQPLPRFHFMQAMEERWLVLVPIPHVTLGGLAEVVAMLIFREFIRAAFARPGSDQTRTDYALMIDELQVLVEHGDPRDVENALSQLRAFGIPAIFLHQALTQLGDAADIVRINTRSNRIIMQTGEPDAGTYAREYVAHGLTAADISFQDPLEHQYAVLRCEGIPCGPFSMRPLPWPELIDADVPPSDGPDWQTLIPVNTPDASFDVEVTRLVYGMHADPTAVAVALAQQLSDTEWEYLLQRWDAIRQVQRQYILDCPGCIPARLERQRWLSRLLVAQPRILAAATYARIRTTIEPAREGHAMLRTRRSKGDPAAAVPVMLIDDQLPGNDIKSGTITVAHDDGLQRVPKFVHADRLHENADGNEHSAVELFSSAEDEA